MKSKKNLAAIIGLLLFGGLIAAAIVVQSAYLLYAASGIPILLVPFLPDIRTSKTLKPGSQDAKIRLYRTQQEGTDGFLIIEADPGAMPWNKRRLYFTATNVPATAASYLPDSAGIPVLHYDLVRHPRKKNMFGIELAHLTERFRTLSYTPDEVTRLVIRIEDLKPAPTKITGAKSQSIGQELQA